MMMTTIIIIITIGLLTHKHRIQKSNLEHLAQSPLSEPEMKTF